MTWAVVLLDYGFERTDRTPLQPAALIAARFVVGLVAEYTLHTRAAALVQKDIRVFL